jgi:DNA-directed RNA polymerase specialized sigma24 family protein
VSTRCGRARPAGGESPTPERRSARPDPADEIARVAHAKREILLRAYRHQLRREDLEDCYSQATLELVAQARRGRSFADAVHLANTLELRYRSRIRDLRRALGGRSPIQAALAGARSLGGAEQPEIAIVDRRAELETLVFLRSDLRRVQRLVKELTYDQKLVLASQLQEVPSGDFCRRFGWSAEKYRKVAQRGRARLKRLALIDEPLSRSRLKDGTVNQGHACD